MIHYDKITKIYEGTHGPKHAVHDVTMTVDEGELCVLLGPSGCGKTTLLRMTNRLIEPTSGNIRVNGGDVMAEDPVQLRRRIGYVIQGVGLFPHRTVAENIGTTLGLLGRPKSAIRERVDELLHMMQLAPEQYRNRYPAELSGGERQRIGVARALAANPPLLLMDEPFGAIDPINRAEIQRQFRDLQQRLGKTTIFVSHDIHEALLLADRIALMNEGRLVQYGRPHELLQSPANDFVERFFGNDREMLLLAAIPATEAMTDRGSVTEWSPSAEEATISAGASLRDALSALLACNLPSIAVMNGDRRILGHVSLESIRQRTSSADRTGEMP